MAARTAPNVATTAAPGGKSHAYDAVSPSGDGHGERGGDGVGGAGGGLGGGGGHTWGGGRGRGGRRQGGGCGADIGGREGAEPPPDKARRRHTHRPGAGPRGPVRVPTC